MKPLFSNEGASLNVVHQLSSADLVIVLFILFFPFIVCKNLRIWTFILDCNTEPVTITFFFVFFIFSFIFRNLQMTGQNQCIVLTGNSGSGKTTQLRNLVHYLCEVAGWTKTLSCALIL